MKKYFICFLIAFSLFSLNFSVSAHVATSKEPTNGDNVYIAGNPELYPIEYYNSETECYEGILPEIFELISKQSGIDFSYIYADDADCQKQLCDNKQCEIISSYIKGALKPYDETELFTFSKDGEQYTVCLGFTDIINDDIKNIIKTEVENLPKEEWLAASMKLDGFKQSDNHLLIYIMIAVLFITILIFIIYIIRHNKKIKEAEQSHMTDELTGIGNTNYLKYSFEHYIPESSYSLYYISYIAIEAKKLSSFLGTTASEEIQRFAADVITNSCGDNDFTARIGDGVFAFCFMAPDTDRAIKVVSDMIEILNGYENRFLREYKIFFRAGVYPLGKNLLPVETAIFNAKQGYNYALHENQTVCLSDHSILVRADLKARLRQKLLKAISNNEFNMYLQFVIDAKSGRICGAEALARWNSPEEGILTPVHFIEDMEIAGIIDKLDFYILEKVCKKLESMSKSKYDHLHLSCNFTRITISAEDFPEKFQDIISKYSFDRNNLIIELTEDSFANNSDISYRNVLAIKQTGCRIALDDFGSGYTSFSDLCDYPVDIIKIDRHIVAKAVDERSDAVLKGIVRFAQELGISVLCEGVETETEDKKIKAIGCDYIQGFLYSRVLPEDNAMAFYDKKQNMQ